MKQAQVSLVSPLGRGRPTIPRRRETYHTMQKVDLPRRPSSGEGWGQGRSLKLSSWPHGSPRHGVGVRPAHQHHTSAPGVTRLEDHHASSETVSSALDRNFMGGKLEGSILQTWSVHMKNWTTEIACSCFSFGTGLALHSESWSCFFTGHLTCKPKYIYNHTMNLDLLIISE